MVMAEQGESEIFNRTYPKSADIANRGKFTGVFSANPGK